LVERDLRFSTDPRLQEAFVNSSGKIRLGMVLEELDTLAGTLRMTTRTRPHTHHRTRTTAHDVGLTRTR
jgi:hypothetical protein